MRHLKAGRALGVKPAHRRAMLRNLVTSLVEEGRITTTLARAKELRKPLDKMITFGKKGDLSSRRQALAFIKSKSAMAKLFGDMAERFQDREGGFSRILRVAPRRGDGAEMAMVILVGDENDPFAEGSKPQKGGRKRTKKVIEEVAEEVQASTETAPKAEEATAEAKAPEAEAGAEAPVEVEAVPEIKAEEKAPEAGESGEEKKD